MPYQIGDHLVSSRKLLFLSYKHHGLYMGNGNIIHYGGLSNKLNKDKVAITNLDDFQKENDIVVIEHKNRKFNGKETIERALQRLDEDNYKLFSNNCEHFVNWCITGVAESLQVQKAAKTAAVASVATLVGTSLWFKIINSKDK